MQASLPLYSALSEQEKNLSLLGKTESSEVVLPDGFVFIPWREGKFAASREGDIYSCDKKEILSPRVTNSGYHTVRMCKGDHNVPYLVHRIIWRTFKGQLPTGMEIDHINRVKTDNRLSNLRCVSHSENQMNHAKHIVNGSNMPVSKFKGVHFIENGVRAKWRAAIYVAGFYLIIGRFYSEREAAMAYDAVANTIRGDQNIASNSALGLL